MRYQDPQLAELLAAEYVLGTLKGRARQRFQALLQAHPALRSKVREWEWRLNRLAAATPPVTPPPATWDGLAQRLFPSVPCLPWRQRLSVWRNLALGSGLLAAVLAVLLVIAPPAPGYVVLINDASQRPVWLITASADRQHLYVKSLKVMNMPEKKRCLLWLQPKDSPQLYALGVLPDKGEAMSLKVAKGMRSMLPGQLLVTVEDSGPLPTAPSSPPHYRGEWMSLDDI
jgi:anti-sigma-K factor RskA